jgi:hypothetical protein
MAILLSFALQIYEAFVDLQRFLIGELIWKNV